MKVNLTMLAHNRPLLTKQALESIGHWDELLVLDDCSNEETKAILNSFDTAVFTQGESRGTGYARNKVIEMSERCYGRGEFLYLSDNDVWFTPNWLETMIECYEEAWKHGFKVLGAYNHPYHQPIASIRVSETHAVHEVYALALQSMLMRWEVWDKYGPFDITPVGRVRMSEDVAFTNKLREDGGRVGVVSPALLVNTGISDSFGEKIPGWEIVETQCPAGVYCE
jgi:glycosyltransferase involved in cell wall biosynthesis